VTLSQAVAAGAAVGFQIVGWLFLARHALDLLATARRP